MHAVPAMSQPLLAGDPVALARKLAGSSGLLQEYWDDYQRRFLADPATRSNMLFLPALLTGDGLDEARAILRRHWEKLPADDGANDVQFHTWCRCGTALRYAIYFDWLAARGAWSEAETAQAAESLVGFAFKHPFLVLQGRTRTSNNQALSMALHCAIIGYLFGHKLARHPTAQLLFDEGLGRLPDLLGLFPADGYGGEGSTYTSHVNTPLLCWTADFLEQLTGRNWFDTPFRPNGTTLRTLIEMERRLVSPGGWLAPWDHYGWQRAINSSPFACLARRTGNPRYLALIPSVTDWSHPGALAWGADDPLWTLVWWPEQFADYNDRELPAELFGWFLPRTGAALDDVTRRSRLMQVWDASADGVLALGRAQCDPNHLMFEYAGEPVFQDGVPVNGADPWPASAMPAKSESGLIGAANAIVVDEEPEYWPGRRCVGQPEYYDGQSVRADCAAFYQPRYDVTRAQRTSWWSNDGFGVVWDVLAARSAHTWRWQVHLRPGVTLAGNTARVALPSGRPVLLAWESVEETRTTKIEGFPRTEEKRCVRLELLQRGAAAEFAVLIAPEAQSAAIRRVGNGEFEVTVDGRTRRVSMTRPGNLPAVKPDVVTLPDLEIDFDWQFPEFAPRGVNFDERFLLTTLRSGDWPAQALAADALGRRNCRAAAPVLRELLRAEHADRELYAPTAVKRWRLKLALIVALGRLGDRESVPLLGQILADGRDFYLVNSVAVQALGRIGGPAALAALTPALTDHEENTHIRAVAARAYLERETT
ncbi:MAG: hypothetical protein PCFJNLEI_01646 [Verrucomicrobiae bacterium]|nr:hypothetical protein [Verrucomicrobiae bacterium]